MPVYDAEVLKTFQTKMTICVVIAIISSVNITALFKYVIDLRRKTMAIFRINGCSKNRLKGIMVSEMMIYSAINILLCISCFNFLILPGLAGILPYVTLAYSVKTIFTCSDLHSCDLRFSKHNDLFQHFAFASANAEITEVKTVRASYIRYGIKEFEHNIFLIFL